MEQYTFTAIHYQGPEIKAVFIALRDDFLAEIEADAINLSWSKEDYDNALEELLPALVRLANSNIAQQQVMVWIYNYSHCGSIPYIPLKLCMIYILYCGLNEEHYFDYIKRLFDGSVGRMGKAFKRQVSFDLEKLKKYAIPKEQFFKVDGRTYCDLHNKYDTLSAKYDEEVHTNEDLLMQLKQKDEELATLRGYAYLMTIVDYMVESDAKPEEKDMLANILSRMYIQNQNEGVKEAYDRLAENISEGKKKQNHTVTVKRGGINIMNANNVNK